MGYEESALVKGFRNAWLQHYANQVPDWTGGTYGQSLKDSLDKITNREQFSYDLNADALYQQYKDQYMTQGKVAMNDTIGQASSMTGGYGNSYAATAGNQTYQGYVQQLTNKIPELYQLAYDKYNQETQDLYNQYDAIGTAYNREYGEHRDKVSDWQYKNDSLSNAYYNESNRDLAIFQQNLAALELAWKAQQAQQTSLQTSSAKKSSGGNDLVTASPELDKSAYAGWSASDWNSYFAQIRQSEGSAAAIKELQEFTSKGIIPTNYVGSASVGARGKMGH